MCQNVFLKVLLKKVFYVCKVYFIQSSVYLDYFTILELQSYVQLYTSEIPNCGKCTFIRCVMLWQTKKCTKGVTSAQKTDKQNKLNNEIKLKLSKQKSSCIGRAKKPVLQSKSVLRWKFPLRVHAWDKLVYKVW